MPAQGQLFDRSEVPHHRRRVRRRRNSAPRPVGVQVELAEQEYLVEDGDQIYELAKDIGGNKWSSNDWVLRYPDGTVFRRIYPPTLKNLAFEDADGGQYLVYPLWEERGARKISAETAFEIAKIVSPEAGLQLATAEHRRLCYLDQQIRRYAAAKEKVERVHRNLKHPGKAESFKRAVRYLEYQKNELLELGLRETQCDLAVQLHNSGLHVREVWNAIQTLTEEEAV